MKSNRNFGLDVLRAISIALVIIAHRFNVDYEFGILGVQVFFVLSGFLIGRILINEFQNGVNLKKLKKFWVRRWYRTLPLYYLLLIIKLLIFKNPFGWKVIAYFLFLQANWVGIGFYSVSWSLVVEEWFYILLPILFWLILNNGFDRKFLIRFLISCTLVFILIRYLWNASGKGIILYQFDCLLLGVLMAAISIFYKSYFDTLSNIYVFVISLIGIVIMLVFLGDISMIPLIAPLIRVFWYLGVSILIALVIPFMMQSDFINVSLKSIKPFYWLFSWTSILTYSIYLIHTEVFWIHVSNNLIIEFFSQLFFLYLFSYILFVFFEYPMMSLREGFNRKNFIHSIRFDHLDV